jgi:hypothetical protein
MLAGRCSWSVIAITFQLLAAIRCDQFAIAPAPNVMNRLQALWNASDA